MDIKVCDRCGKIYIGNQNDRFLTDGITGVDVIERISGNRLKYDLCDNCCHELFGFLELETTYARNGHNTEDILI